MHDQKQYSQWAGATSNSTSMHVGAAQDRGRPSLSGLLFVVTFVVAGWEPLTAMQQ